MVHHGFPLVSLKSETSPLHLADGAAEARQSLLGANYTNRNPSNQQLSLSLYVSIRSGPFRSDPVLSYPIYSIEYRYI
jgi:hypothetical protein